MNEQFSENRKDESGEKNKKTSGPEPVTFILPAASLFLLVLLDQLTKSAALRHLKGQPPVRILPGILELVYVENSGISFGLFQNSAILVSFFSAVWIGIMLYFLLRILKHGGLWGLCTGLIMASAGAFGNFIDRIRFRYVIDFIYISFINFPVFNIADILVVTGMILLVFLILFIYREDDLHAL